MSDIYKLQYNGMTLAYPGWNGFVAYNKPENPPYQRYEYTLFESPDGLGVSAGTVFMPYTATGDISNSNFIRRPIQTIIGINRTDNVGGDEPGLDDPGLGGGALG